MTEKWCRMNANNWVKVRLTDFGKEVHRRYFEGGAGGERYSPPEGEWYKEQLWVLMQIFGPHTGMGIKPPFETEIIVCCDSEVSSDPPHWADIVGIHDPGEEKDD